MVELAGMISHCDFIEQQTLSGNDRRIRPDVVIKLPGGKSVIVDAKVPLDAYLRALEAPDEAAFAEGKTDVVQYTLEHA